MRIFVTRKKHEIALREIERLEHKQEELTIRNVELLLEKFELEEKLFKYEEGEQ